MAVTTDNRLLYSLRGQQLQQLARIVGELNAVDAEAVRRFAQLAGAQYDARNLSDKSLEQIDSIAGRYFT
jgi:hypothetical protein